MIRLNAHQLAILAPLYARREALRRELQAVELGIGAVAKAFAGIDDPRVKIIGDDAGGAWIEVPEMNPTNSPTGPDGPPDQEN